jgi:hypothetical protein
MEPTMETPEQTLHNAAILTRDIAATSDPIVDAVSIEPGEAGSDAFHRLFVSRIGPTMAARFDDEQRAAVKRAFGSRMTGTHPVDVRQSINFFGYRFYFVLLAGPERRTVERRNEKAKGMGQLVLAGLCELLALAAVAGGLLVLMSGKGP